MKLLASLSLKVKIIAGAAVTAAIAGTITLVLVLSSPDAFRLLKVFEMAGKSMVTRVNSGEMDAYEGMNLESGDIVEVGETSTMTLSLDNDKYLSLDPSTVLELIAEGTEEDSKTTVNLRSGGVLNEITEPLSAESSYSVNTPKATMAVRGTSFYVSVKALDDGSYITDISVFHGKVEVQLLDEEGNPKGEPVIVKPNESVAVLTVPVEGNTTGAEINGTSCFILRKNDGSDVFAIVGEGEDPVMPLNVMVIPKSVIERVLNTHDNTEIVLSEDVLRALMGDNAQAEGIEKTEKLEGEETTASETSAETEAITTTVPETTTTESETTVPAAETIAEVTTVTTVPVTEATTVTTVTAATIVTEKTTVTSEEFEIVEEEFEDPHNDENEDNGENTDRNNQLPPMPDSFIPPYQNVPSATTTTRVTTTTEMTTTTAEETTTTEETTEEEPVYHTVNFVSNPGNYTVAEPQDVEDGEYAEAPDFMEYIYIDGKAYVFWEVENPLGPITGDTDISVRYVEEGSMFTVVVTDKGETVLSGTYNDGESFTLPSPKYPIGFKYWALMGANSGGVISERGQYDASEEVTVDENKAYLYEAATDTNIRFEAVYESVTITYMYDGTVYSTVTSYTVGDTYFIAAFDSAAAGASGTFSGYTGDDGNIYSYGDAIVLTGDLTLDANVT